MRKFLNSPQSECLAVSADDLAKLLNVSARHIWNLAASGKLPPPIRLGRTTRWILADVQMHLDKLREPGERGA